jgi:hypothetical protein
LRGTRTPRSAAPAKSPRRPSQRLLRRPQAACPGQLRPPPWPPRLAAPLLSPPPPPASRSWPLTPNPFPAAAKHIRLRRSSPQPPAATRQRRPPPHARQSAAQQSAVQGTRRALLFSLTPRGAARSALSCSWPHLVLPVLLPLDDVSELGVHLSERRVEHFGPLKHMRCGGGMGLLVGVRCSGEVAGARWGLMGQPVRVRAKGV